MTEHPCICISLRKATRRLSTQYDAALEPAGISLAQFSLLRNVNRHGPLSLTGLSEITELDRSTLGRNLRVLERMGLVALKPGDDHREATVTLSEGGKAVLAKSIPLWEDAQARITGKIGVAGAAQLEALLGAL